jgi:predicted TPR repeat methyltransferase
MDSSPTASIEAGEDAPAALARAVDHLRHGRSAQAEALLAAVLERWPGQRDARHFLGVLRHEQGRGEEAVALIGGVLAESPQHHGAWNNLGNVLLGLQREADARQAYEHAVVAAGDSPDAASPLANLAAIHRRHGRLAEAEACCRTALEHEPDFAEAWYGLSLVLMQTGRVSEGLQANSRAITLWPRHLIARGRVIGALLLLGERERAAVLYREWLAEEPDNPLLQHQLAACVGEQAPARASDGAMEQLFDAFADSFDVNLEALRYRAPALVAESLAAAVGEPKAALDIVDAGCGTGLCGPLLRPFARRLAGCDLSTGMLRKALPRRCYDVLHQAELMHYLNTQPSAFDVVASADTLCYFGDLHPPLAAAARALRPGGWLIFTVEALAQPAPAGHRLHTTGRYAHSQAHVTEAAAAAGFAPGSVSSHTLRMEGGKEVAGWLVRLQLHANLTAALD